MSDRQAAHYYREMHTRAVQRGEQWKKRALAAEQIVKQLLVLLRCCGQKIGKLTRHVAWFNKQCFGSKSEATRPAPPATAPASEGAKESAKEGAEQAPAQGKRKPGQQPGAKGPKRQHRPNLPVEPLHHRLSDAERTCSICHKIHPEIGLTEESEEIEWEVRLKRVRHIRHCYLRGCHCVPGPKILTAPKPAKLILKGLFAVSFWAQVLLKKFEFKQPLQRIVGELNTLGLKVSPGTLDGGLQKIAPMLQPLVGQFVMRARQGCHWHMDETRWPMWLLVYGQGEEGEGHSPKKKNKWWAWVLVGQEATAFLLEPTRSGDVPETILAKGTEGIVNVDRYKGYFGLLGPDWKIQLAFCWSHQRRDFINLAEGSRGACKVWAQEWVGLINQLFKANRHRRHAWLKDRSDFSVLDQEVRRQVQEIKRRLDRELAAGQLAPEEEKILKSMRAHWQGLTVFVEHPHVPMDNNAAERALRALAVARKNFYGSRAQWSGELAMGCFTIFATLRQHGICPRRYLQAYLEACARAGGKAPAHLEEFLPWNWSQEKKAAWRTQEQAP